MIRRDALRGSPEFRGEESNPLFLDQNQACCPSTPPRKRGLQSRSAPRRNSSRRGDGRNRPLLVIADRRGSGHDSPVASTKTPRRIVILAFPGVQPLDVVGPAEVFAGADALAGGGAYTVEVVAKEPGPITTRSSGYGIVPKTTTARCRGPIDTLVVAGGFGVAKAENDAGADPLDPQRRPPLAPSHLRLLRSLPARPGRPARGPDRHDPLGLDRRACPPPPGAHGRPQPDLRPRRERLDLRRRHLRDGSLPRPGGGGPRSRDRRRDRPLARPLPPAPRRPGPVQHPPLGAARRAPARCASSSPGSPTTSTPTSASRPWPSAPR